jgi:presenilin-like A22 family membrane protease
MLNSIPSYATSSFKSFYFLMNFIAFELTFQRSSPMFKAIAVTPTMVIVFMTLVSFWLPPQAGEKVLLNGIACVLICLLLLYFSQQLTIHAASAPFIGKLNTTTQNQNDLESHNKQ